MLCLFEIQMRIFQSAVLIRKWELLIYLKKPNVLDKKLGEAATRFTFSPLQDGSVLRKEGGWEERKLILYTQCSLDGQQMLHSAANIQLYQQSFWREQQRHPSVFVPLVFLLLLLQDFEARMWKGKNTRIAFVNLSKEKHVLGPKKKLNPIQEM